MRTLALLVLIAAAAAYSGVRERFVIPSHNRVGVYENRIRILNEDALYVVGPEDRLLVLGEMGPYLKVQNAQGKPGWIEKRLVSSIDASARILFQEAMVKGYIDVPTPVYIINGDDPADVPIRLDRSFRDDLLVNVDQGTVERAVR